VSWYFEDVKLLAPWTCVVLAACAPLPPPTVVSTPPPQPVATSEADAAPDISPVPEPKDVLVVGRWSRPAKGIEEMLGAFGVPLSMEKILQNAAADEVRLIDTEASLDVALALDPESTDDSPKLLAALSIPVKSFEEARQSLEKEGPVARIAPGVVRQEGKGKEKVVCDLAVATGDVGARVVCGEHARDVDALRPWLTRTLPRTAPVAGELNVSVRAAPMRARYLAPLRTKATALADEARAELQKKNIRDADLLAAPSVVFDEGLRFLEDLDAIDLRVSFTKSPPELVAGGVLHFAGKSSWLTRVITEQNDKAGPPPPIFWRVPRDATSATWGRGNDPRLYDGVRKVVRKALVEVLSSSPLPDADKGALIGFVDSVPLSSGAWVTSQGLAKGKAAVKAASPKDPIDWKHVATTAIGWTVVGVEAPAASYVAWAKQGVDVYARALRIARDFAKGANVKAKDLHTLDVLPSVKIAASPPGWPKGTVAFDVSVSSELPMLFLPKRKDAEEPKKAPTVKGTITIRLAIVPDGDRTWIGLSADPEDLKKRMNGVMPGAPEQATLAAREGLEPLRAPGQTWGGFFSAGELLERALQALEREKPEHGDDARAAMAALPNRGRTPVLLVGKGSGGDKPSNTAEVRLEAGTLADIAALAGFLASPRGKELLKKF
jgi:hypothetical protein